MNRKTKTDRGRKMERHRKTDRQTDRLTNRQKDRQTETGRQTDRKANTQTGGEVSQMEWKIKGCETKKEEGGHIKGFGNWRVGNKEEKRPENKETTLSTE